MKLVVIESPYAGDIEANVAYAKRCVLDCLKRGEAPYASHLFFTQPGLLDDGVAEQRELGIAAGLMWGGRANVVAVYVDRGISSGMRQGIEAASARGKHIEVRALDREVTKEDLLIVYRSTSPALDIPDPWRDEKRVIELITDRLRMGAADYGPLKIEADPRDWRKEATEELLDGCVYLAAALLRLRTKEGNPL